MTTIAQSLSERTMPVMLRTGITQGTRGPELARGALTSVTRWGTGEWRAVSRPLMPQDADPSEATEAVVLRVLRDMGLNPFARSATPASAQSAIVEALKLFVTSPATDHENRGQSFLAESILRDLVLAAPEGGWASFDVSTERERAKQFAEVQLQSRAISEVEAAFLPNDNSDQSLLQFGHAVHDVMIRYGLNGARAVADWVAKQVMPRDAAWCAIEQMGMLENNATAAERRSMLLGLLESPHAGVRYEAASALEFLWDEQVAKAAKRRLDEEKGQSVKAALSILIR